MKQRAVVALMQHETNTFSPVPTPLERFEASWSSEEEIFDYFKGTGTSIGAFLDVADREGMEIRIPFAGHAAPSGPVDAKTYRVMCDAICQAVRAGCDVCFLDLHGAMVSEVSSDGEGTLLEEIRKIAPELPIAVSLDLHANLTDKIVSHCTALVGYKTYPHLDMYQAGEQAGRIVVAAMKGKIQPVMSWGNRPILAQTLRMGHEDRPMGPLLELARQAERDGLLAASIFGGFPLADFWDAGLSVVTVSDGDRQAAERTCEGLLDAAWRERHEFVFESEALAETIDRAKRLQGGPIILLDHADNAASGGTQDTVRVLEEVIEQGLEEVAMFAICDPQAVEEMADSGVGNTLTLKLGGKFDMPAIGRKGEPLELRGAVRAITDGNFVVTAEMGCGTTEALGRTAVFDIGRVQIVVTSRHCEPFDLGCFRSVGIEPTQMRYLILKSRIHYRAGFSAIAAHELPCSGVGVTSSDNNLFDFKSVRRPIFPLDPETPSRPDYRNSPLASES